MEKQVDLVIVGGGPAGLAAAVSAWDSGVRSLLVLDREEQPGGILQQCIHNGFGLHKLGKELTGPEYAHVYIQKVKERGIPLLSGAMALDITGERRVTAQNSRDGVFQIQARAVILAMGCRERSRGALNICGSRPAGIYTAGTAQKLINRKGCLVGKRAVILGSGDIGLIMARRLTLEGAKVEAVCELMPYSGGLTRNIVQCLQDYDIPLLLRHTVTQIHGRNRLEGVTISQADEEGRIIADKSRFIPCDTLLLSVGLIPENELSLGAGVRMAALTRGAEVDENRQTSVSGIFACGNVLHVHDLVDYVSEEAELAGRSAARYLNGELPAADTVPVEPGSGVRYVLPQKLHPGAPQDVTLFFRVGKPMGPVNVRVLCGDKTLAQARRRRAVPGEMERITVKSERTAALDGPVRVELEAL